MKAESKTNAQGYPLVCFYLFLNLKQFCYPLIELVSIFGDRTEQITIQLCSLWNQMIQLHLFRGKLAGVPSACSYQELRWSHSVQHV